VKTRLFGWAAVAVLVALVLLRPVNVGDSGLAFLLSAIAAVLTIVTGLAGRYVLAAALTLVAVLFNPIVPVTLVSQRFFWMYLVSLAFFSICLTALNIYLRPRLSMPSITGRTPGSQSL
jgi:hypothetical protein